uniref:Cytochrome P450 n=1 Tax=Photinus pyralis TaxID=7054 RepID=A0A1Y1KP85_PHOPY
MAILYLAGAVLCVVLYFAFLKRFTYWKSRGVPQYSLLVNFRELLLGLISHRGTTETIQTIYNAFPGSRYCGDYQCSTPILVIRDLELIKKVAVVDFDHFTDHVNMSVAQDSEPIWKNNLLALKGDKWKDMRATLSPSFTSSKMKAMFNLISNYSKAFVEYCEEHPDQAHSMEMKDVFTRFTNDIIATCAFGINCDSMRNPQNEFYLMGKDITNFTGFWVNFRMIFTFLFPRLAKRLQITFFSKRATHFFATLIRENIASREQNGIIRPDMIHLLLEARKGKAREDSRFTVTEGVADRQEEKRKKEQLTDLDITAQALIFFLAGFDTVSSLMCFMAHELAVNADIQERLQLEVDDIMRQCEGNITYEALSKMEYMDMVVSETMRKWPSPVFSNRACTKSYTIEPEKEGEKAVKLNVNDPILIPIFAIHRDENNYENPTRFDPERFNRENKASVLPYQFIPFGVGPRSCIGNRFALMETKLAFFYLLSKFNLVVTEKTDVPLQLGKHAFHLNAKNGFWLGLKARTP